MAQDARPEPQPAGIDPALEDTTVVADRPEPVIEIDTTPRRPPRDTYADVLLRNTR